MKSGKFNFPELSGPHRACNGTALPLPLPLQYVGYSESKYRLRIAEGSDTVNRKNSKNSAIGNVVA